MRHTYAEYHRRKKPSNTLWKMVLLWILRGRGNETMKNIFADIPDAIPEEIFETIIEKESFRLERIVSDGQLTAEDEWYDEDENEWFILLKGSAGLLLEGDREPLVLKPGDYLNLPAHRRHKVLWTDADEKTVWLALHHK
jgi:cupin 2 domain-containing protein